MNLFLVQRNDISLVESHTVIIMTNLIDKLSYKVLLTCNMHLTRSKIYTRTGFLKLNPIRTPLLHSTPSKFTHYCSDTYESVNVRFPVVFLVVK